MKHLKYLSYTLHVALCLLLGACSEERVTYDGPDFVMFSDSVHTLPIVDNDSVFDICVSAAHVTSYDRTLAVELLAQQSNAIRGYHFDLLNQTVTIPAGELTGSVKVRGYQSHLETDDSVGFFLRLLPGNLKTSSLYGTDTRIMLQKAKRFDLQDFVGYAVVQSSWILNYMPAISSRLIRVEADPEVKNRVILRNLYYKGYDVKLDLMVGDLSNPLVHFERQTFAPTTEAFGTIYGNGKIMMDENLANLSYYSSLERYIWFYTDLSVDNVGTVGTFVHLIAFISDDQAEQLIKEGIDH